MFPKRRSNSGDFEVFEEAEGVSDLCLEGREEERERDSHEELDQEQRN
jgi:hypothetical protein